MSLVAHTIAGSGADTNTIITPAINTTGASLLVVFIARYTLGGAVTLSDSKSNSWTAGVEIGTATNKLRPYYCFNPTVGSGHTFTAGGTAIFATIAVQAHDLTPTSPNPFDASNAHTQSTGATNASGTITPGQNNSLIILGYGATAAMSVATVDGSFQISDATDYVSSQHFSLAMAYKTQTLAAAIGSTWTRGQNTFSESQSYILDFKTNASAGGRGSLVLLGVGA